jgi:UDP-glucose 4-epimerase
MKRSKISKQAVRNWAVVGGAGFIGSHFCRAILESGDTVVAIDNLSSGTLSRIAPYRGNGAFSFSKVDALQTKKLQKILYGVDIVVHLASNPDIARAAHEPRIDFVQGTSITESVIEASRISGVEKILYASGSGVYLDSGSKILKEDSMLQPISTYGASKLAGEMLLSAYSYMFGLKSIAFRFANVVGSQQTHGVGYDFIRKLKNNPRSLDVMGNGMQSKSYIHVEDVIRGVLLAEKSVEMDFDIFNIATEQSLTVSEIAHMASEVVNGAKATIEISYGTSDRGWKGDVPVVNLNSSKLRKLGWKPQYSSREAMKLALESLKHELI